MKNISLLQARPAQSRLKFLSVCFAAALVTACGGGSSGGEPETDTSDNSDPNALINTNVPVPESSDTVELCSVPDINRWIDERMRDDYIYYDSVPVVDLASYDDPVLLLRDLRVLPDIYSSVVDAAESEQVTGNSVVTRFGFNTNIASDGRTHFSDISGNSPMALAGIRRGDLLIAVNGVDWNLLTDEEFRDFIIGEQGQELTAVFTVQSAGDVPRDVTVTKTTFTETTVPVFGTYPQTNDQVGYMKVDSFRGTTGAEVNQAVSFLVNGEISDLILDLRYNGGGFTYVARMLASQIAGSAFQGEVYSRRVYNDKYSFLNTDQFIEPQTLNLNLPRLFVLTTEFTASASETLINGLKPFIEVITIGNLTEGKPFTSVAQDYCGKRLNAMSTLTTNGVGSDVNGGINPTCRVQDDYLFPADFREDALTGAAFTFMESGSCPAPVGAVNDRVVAKVSEATNREIPKGGY